jgi:DNA-directed RNA polymerase specialized sigma24 family protein
MWDEQEEYYVGLPDADAAEAVAEDVREIGHALIKGLKVRHAAPRRTEITEAVTKALRAAIARGIISRMDGLAWHLRFVRGWTMHEVAEGLHLSYDQALRACSRCREALRGMGLLDGFVRRSAHR